MISNNRSKILLIESDPEIQESTARILDKESFLLSILSNADGVFDKILNEHPDLILCDSIPELDIPGVLGKIKTHSQTAEVPFILLTKNSNTTDIRNAMLSGAENFLPIPFSQEELLHTLRSHLLRYRHRSQRDREMLKSICHDIAAYLPHELMTPLNNILNLSELMAEEVSTLTPEDLTVIGKTLRSSSNRLLDRIRSFLFFQELHFQVITGSDISHHYPFLNINMANQIQTISESIASRYMRLDDLELALNDATIHISPDLLNTALKHTIDNAFKFSARGSPVSIYTKICSNAFIIEIHDSGRGMSHEQIDNIAPLRQFDRSKFEQQGTGLGLATTYAIQHLLKGKIHLASRPEGGLKVTLKLPLSETS